MPTPKKGARLGGSPAHQKLILANLATSLFEHGRITTTEAKARTLRPYAERLITKAKKGDLHNRRQVLAVVRDKGVVHNLFEEIGPRFAQRPGGYTRITKLGPRKGDNAPMAVIELVTEEYVERATSTRTEAPAAATTDVADDAATTDVADDAATTDVADDAATTDVADDAATAEPSADDAPPTEQSDETVTETEGADLAAFEETVGGFEGKYPDSHVPLENASQAPEGYPIKGNEDSMKYHTPDGQWYDQSTAEVWFSSEEAAQAAGFTKAGESAES